MMVFKSSPKCKCKTKTVRNEGAYNYPWNHKMIEVSNCKCKAKKK